VQNSILPGDTDTRQVDFCLVAPGRERRVRRICGAFCDSSGTDAAASPRVAARNSRPTNGSPF
jgi:hypothetical protein